MCVLAFVGQGSCSSCSYSSYATFGVVSVGMSFFVGVLRSVMHGHMLRCSSP